MIQPCVEYLDMDQASTSSVYYDVPKRLDRT